MRRNDGLSDSSMVWCWTWKTNGAKPTVKLRYPEALALDVDLLVNLSSQLC